MQISPRLRRFFPFLQWPRPTPAGLRQDVWAGITVGLVLVPQAVAYAALAGMPAETGLYAALLPAIVGILWGSAPLLAVGPVALTSLLTFGSLAPLAEPGSAKWVGLAIWLSLYAGLIQFLLGAFRLGRIASLVSQPVMTGFINAAAIIIIVSQLPALTGLRADDPGSLMRQLRDDGTRVLLSCGFGLASLLLLALFKRLWPAFPGVLAVCVLGIGAGRLLDYERLGGAVVGAIPAGLPALSLPPSIPLASHQELWPAALVLALISFTEAMTSCRALSRKRNEAWDENQELIGQGLAKTVAGFTGAFPVSGSFSRSALNLYAGAQSAWATLVATLCVLLSLLFLTDLIRHLPLAVLAAMIMMPVFSLLDLRALRRLFAVSRLDAAIALVTFFVTLFSMPRLHWGVVAGVVLTMGAFLYRRTEPRIIEVSLHADGTLRDRARFSLPPLAPDLLAVRIDAALNFLTSAALLRFIGERCRQDRGLRRVLLCASGINDIDTTGTDALAQLHASLQAEGISLQLCSVKKQVMEMLEKAGFAQTLGPARIFPTDSAAVAALSEGGGYGGIARAAR
ncbi:SulP family inorganic anion transporter [Noviherbaspirillum aridicola]|uniref:Sodium-independent anion transporter n=1 Tax=Noviherbaspirillum aridicola TaxID=2849687 RepID=A0ABQ4Q1U7_9BURK|nr:SulP family inorganic anion transporter [Noviherbaspirillum aridicola]GIZ50825.1 sodium-independent anion transporter [Noviherbaspirillum aridicola]